MPTNRITDVLRQFASLDTSKSDAALWVFRKKKVAQQVSYKTKWINSDEPLLASLTSVIATYQTAFSEALPYSALMQPNSNQFLYIPTTETHVNLLTDLTDRNREEHEVDDLKDLENVTGYVLKLVVDNKSIYAIKRAESSWKTKKSLSLLNAIYRGGELSLVDDRTFRLDTKFDLIVFGDTVLIDSKSNFETLLDYTDDFKHSFSETIKTEEFASIFESTSHLVNYIGANMLRLRRMHVVAQKSVYKRPDFLARVREVNSKRQWGLTFTKEGKLIATAENAALILTLLMDHRLNSELTDNTYDVQSTTEISKP